MIRRKYFNYIFAATLAFVMTSMNIHATELPAVSDNSVVEETVMNDEIDVENDAEADVASDETVQNELTVEANAGIKGFVTRLYNVCLDREPDNDGMNYWVNLLETGQENGIHTAFDFIFSEEFCNKNLCNDDYVKYLYKAFMGREYDVEGLNYWVGLLNLGTSREEVFNGFATSKEFAALCDDYQIAVGVAVEVPQYGTVPRDKCTVCGKQDGVTAFITRLYNVCLDREPDEEGLNYWRYLLWTHARTGADISSYFIFSEEFENKDLSDEEFIEYMYRAFFNREYDSEGKSYWLWEMYDGMNRSHVFAGFVNSKEFSVLCQQYGITLGTYTPVDDALTPDYVAKMSYVARERLILGEYYGQGTLTKAQANSLMTTITVPVWDFLNTNSMTKVRKNATLTCNKYVADYFKMAFEELFQHPAQPVIHPGSFYAYSYRANVNNPSVLSNHSYGTAIDINPGENPNKKAMVTKDAWNAMPQGTVSQMQKKEYTIYEGSPYYEVLYGKYHLMWLGYNRTPDAMHFEF